VELRDKGTFGFLLPANQIIPSVRPTSTSASSSLLAL
jgi:hypothetical protein